MKKLTIMMMMMIFLMVGCGDTITEYGDSVSVNCGEGGCGDITVGDNNEIHKGEESQSGTTPSVEFDLNNFDKSLTQGECNDLGFFYCTVVGECLPQPLDTGSCPNK